MKNNRRNFLKSNLVLGLGAAATGMSIAKTEASINSLISKEFDKEQLLSHYLKCLGGPFPEPSPLFPKLLDSIKKDGYRIDTLSYEVEPGDRVSALLLVPDKITERNPAPGIAVWHQHNGEYHLGKSEPAGLSGNPMHHTGVALVKEGYVVLCPDALCFEERQDPTGILKGGEYERFEFLSQVVRGRSLAWKNILDMQRAIDLLCDQPEVVEDKIGCYGHSMGSTHAWLVGPLEPRLKCIIGNCCLPTYEAIEEKHILHCFPNFVPGWKNYGDTPEIAALIAPRSLHLNLGENDSGSPIESARRGVQRIADVYSKMDVPDNFSFFIEPDTGHVLTDTMWEHVKECFNRNLKSV